MRTIAIILDDNDFGNTIRPLLQTVARALEQAPDLDAKSIELGIREAIGAHYRLFQARNAEPIAQVDRYLKELLRVLFDEEAERDIETADHDHGAFYLECQTGQIHPY